MLNSFQMFSYHLTQSLLPFLCEWQRIKFGTLHLPLPELHLLPESIYFICAFKQVFILVLHSCASVSFLLSVNEAPSLQTRAQFSHLSPLCRTFSDVTRKNVLSFLFALPYKYFPHSIPFNKAHIGQELCMSTNITLIIFSKATFTMSADRSFVLRWSLNLLATMAQVRHTPSTAESVSLDPQWK